MPYVRWRNDLVIDLRFLFSVLIDYECFVGKPDTQAMLFNYAI